MTLQELIARFRVLAHDKADPPFWSSEDIARWLSDGQTQACIRGRLLRMDKNALEAYAAKYETNLDKRKSEATLRAQVANLIEQFGVR